MRRRRVPEFGIAYQFSGGLAALKTSAAAGSGGGASAGLSLDVIGQIGFGVAGALLGGFGARARNKALANWAQVNFNRIDKYITNARVDAIRELSAMSRAAQGEVSSLLNVAPEGIAATETIASRVVSGVAADTYAVREGLERSVQAAQWQKQDIATKANSEMQMPGVAGIIAGAQGAMDFGSVLDLAQEYSQTGDLATMQAGLSGNEKAIADMGVGVARQRFRSEGLRNQWLKSKVDSMVKEVGGSSIGDINRHINLRGLYDR